MACSNDDANKQYICLSAYRPLSAFKTYYKITGILKHDASFAVCLFQAANGALFVQKQLGFSVSVSVASTQRPPVLKMSVVSYVLNAKSGRYADTTSCYATSDSTDSMLKTTQTGGEVRPYGLCVCV